MAGSSLPAEAFTSAAGGSNPWQSLAPPAISDSGGGSDYFSSVHLPDTAGGTSTGTRIASPFAMHEGASTAAPASTSGAPASSEPHPWAALFGDSGGLKTALPDGIGQRAGPAAFAIPPTPAANGDSVPQRPPSGALGLKLPHMPGSRLTLPTASSLKLPPSFRSGGASATASNTLPPPRTSSKSPQAEDLSRFKPLDVEALAKVLTPPSQSGGTRRGTADDVLVLDIRPSTSFLTARVQSSINVCAPSTLLKRPGVTVERIEQDMLGSAKERRRFMRWRKGPQRTDKGTALNGDPPAATQKASTFHTTDDTGITKIIVLDTDTANVGDAGNATAGGGGPCLIGMLKKFEIAGYAGELCWLRGGFNRLVSTSLGKSLIESGPTDQGDAHDDEDKEKEASVFAEKTPRASPIQLQLDGARLPSRPASMDSGRKGSLVRPRGLPMEAFQAQSTIAGWPGMSQSSGAGKDAQAAGAGGAGGGNGQTVQGVVKNACANPFFDNIRQNRELAHGITEKIPMDLPAMSRSQVEALPRFLRDLVEKSPEDRATLLAQGFFDVEKAEQQRLIATMQQHAAESGLDPRSLPDCAAPVVGGSASSATLHHALSPTSAINDLARTTQRDHRFPFSISAALERGADNRYNNIWTYEHSRVKLSKPQAKADPGSDYLNGSFVAPAQRFGSQRKYIATQAPLPSTFEAFWTAIWEQNCRVIVMLTREHESGRLQSHAYWNDSEFGALIRVDKFEEVVLDERGRTMGPEESRSVLQPDTASGGLFSGMSASTGSRNASSGMPTTIRRSFRLRNLADPASPVRRITQLQYIAWPDYHIPETPDSLLDLIDLADALQNEADLEIRQTAISSGRSALRKDAHAGPMVVHCSAGVGRTGAFIVINAALDVLRRCRRLQLGQTGPGTSDLAPWQNRTTQPVSSDDRDGSSPTTDVEMPPSTPVRRRSTRRSLKRELSPTGMDIDGNLDEWHHDVSSPPPTLRTRSSDGGMRDTARDMASWTPSHNATVSTPSRAFGSLQIRATASPGFVNPFGSSNYGGGSSAFNFEGTATPATPSAGAGAGPSEAPLLSSEPMTASARDRGLSRSLFGAPLSSSSSSSNVAPGASSANDYRGANGSSPFSEVSTPSFPTGLSSTRSSFSFASAGEKPSAAQLQRSTSTTSHESNESAASSSSMSSIAASWSMQGSQRRASIESLNKRMSDAMNPFEAAMHSNGQGSTRNTSTTATTAAALATRDRSSESNEPTPFPTYPCTSSDAAVAVNPTTATSSMSLTPSPGHGSKQPSGAAADPGAGGLAAEEQEIREGTKAAKAALEEGQDIIRKTVDTAREQRMSLIQTCRQYVFVYSAVLAALLRDLEAEGGRRSSPLDQA
ncbi:hypothetical protein ACQY0O_004879 [Thecaphora frezii]